jgi:protein gp37
MAENSKIQWTHHTFNPWRGCARVSLGCVHCYAETLSKRNPKTLGVWGVEGTRVIASDAMWKQPRRWDDAARIAGERHRVFCASLADVGEDRPDLVAPRKRLQTLIWLTPHLDWLLLTKRPENMTRLFDREVLEMCWVGTTCENQEYANKRIPFLLNTPARVRFISAEPLLGPVNLGAHIPAAFRRRHTLDWVIVGGESGGGARPFDIAWAREIIRQCAEAGVACFMKQLGANADNSAQPDGSLIQATLNRKGDNIDEWPADLRVREFPFPVIVTRHR